MNLRCGFHRFRALLAGLWLVVAFSLPAYPRHRLVHRLTEDADAFSPAFWLTFLGNLKMVAFAVGPFLAVYVVLGWALVTPAAWVFRGFSVAKTDGSTQSAS